MPGSSCQAGLQVEWCCCVHEHLVHNPSCHPRKEKVNCQGLSCSFLLLHHRGPKLSLTLGQLHSPNVLSLLKLSAFHSVWGACLLLFFSSAGREMSMDFFLTPLSRESSVASSWGMIRPWPLSLLSPSESSRACWMCQLRPVVAKRSHSSVNVEVCSLMGAFPFLWGDASIPCPWEEAFPGLARL